MMFDQSNLDQSRTQKSAGTHALRSSLDSDKKISLKQTAMSEMIDDDIPP